MSFPQHLNILLVDDSRAIRALMKRELTAMLGSPKFYEAGDGAEALATIKTYAIDLMFLDINMPCLDGIETLQHLRTERRNVRVIMVTADGGHSQVKRAMEFGASGYIVKPFSRMGLEKAVTRALVGFVPTPAAPSSPAAGAPSDPFDLNVLKIN